MKKFLSSLRGGVVADEAIQQFPKFLNFRFPNFFILWIASLRSQ